MGIFENICILGFRRLQKFDLELRPLCVLVGANGCGKTSLLDVFSMLAASASGAGSVPKSASWEELQPSRRSTGSISGLLSIGG